MAERSTGVAIVGLLALVACMVTAVLAYFGMVHWLVPVIWGAIGILCAMGTDGDYIHDDPQGLG